MAMRTFLSGGLCAEVEEACSTPVSSNAARVSAKRERREVMEISDTRCGESRKKRAAQHCAWSAGYGHIHRARLVGVDVDPGPHAAAGDFVGLGARVERTVPGHGLGHRLV